ncbi:MAG: FG-GAP-like repeat-containing protein [Planctomycetota bacterium]|nr:FG-GAP-like repeat-containing protein [Planctomycetota bacterium]
MFSQLLEKSYNFNSGSIIRDFWLPVLLISLVLAPCQTVLAIEICDNGIDDDNDGFIDCEDSECFNFSGFVDSAQTLGNSLSWDTALGDLDGDGDLDAFVVNEELPDKVWINQGGLQGGTPGEYLDSGQNLGLLGFRVALGDVDGDGDLDAFVAAIGSMGSGAGEPNRIWINQGGQQSGIPSEFLDSGQQLGSSWSSDVALGDLDSDGDLDAFVANDTSGNTVWINQGGVQAGVVGQFLDSGQALGSSSSIAVSLGDVDGDGDLDALVANAGQPDRIYLNDGGGIYSDSGQELTGLVSSSWDGSLADVDGDGDLDVFIATFGGPNVIWLNTGIGTFIDSGQALGNSESIGLALGDVDGDGDLDAFFGNLGGAADKVWINQGGAQGGTSGQYLDSGQELGSSFSSSVALGDVDNDGDFDAFVASFDVNTVWLNHSCSLPFEDCTNGIDDDGDLLIDCDDPDCVGVSNLEVTCNTVAGVGNYTMVFDLVNHTPYEVHHLFLPVGPIVSGGVTLTPTVTSFSPPLSPGGGSTSVSLEISGGGIDQLPICFPVSLMSIDDATGDLFECCVFDICTVLPDCVVCLDVTDEHGTWVNPVLCQYDFLLHNQPGDLPLVAEFAYLVPTTPGITVTDNGIFLGGMIDGGAINLSTTISGASPGQEVCFLITLHDATLADCCGIQHCFTLPPLLNPPPAEFLRGDANADASFDLADVIDTLDFIFLGEPVPCLVALDSNDDEQVDIADAVFSLAALFTGGAEPAPPTLICGPDPTPDNLDCVSFQGCP